MVFSFFLWPFVQVFRQISIGCQSEFWVVASIEFWDCTRLGSLAQSRFGSFAFALSFLKVISQNFRFFKSYERSQGLSQFGFQNSSGLLVFQIGLISGLVNCIFRSIPISHFGIIRSPISAVFQASCRLFYNLVT